MDHVETAVVGGGQAGLSASWHLSLRGREHVVIDRGRVGDTWRRRWDSFCLVTPNWMCQLPGYPYDGTDRGGFMVRDEIVDYVEGFAESFDAPYRSGVDVERVGRPAGDGFLLETSAGPLGADNVIVATGTFQHPKTPHIGSRIAEDVVQLHTRDYRNPAQLPAGAVLVVGSGQSGCQIVDDLHLAGRQVHLAVGTAPRIPRRYRGRDFTEWLVAAGLFELPVDRHPDGPAVRFKAHPHVSGRDGGRTIDLRGFGRDGIRLHGHVADAQGYQLSFSDDLAQSLDAVDEGCRKRLAAFDEYIAREGIDAPPNDIEPIDWEPDHGPLEIDLREEGIGCVIYGTGYRSDFSWIDLPVMDERGYPRYERGVSEIPGLYFVGLHWMYTWGSGLFYQVGEDARYVVDHLVDRTVT